MYYAEKVINGVLCWRSHPDGDWVPFTKEQLTRRLFELDKAEREI